MSGSLVVRAFRALIVFVAVSLILLGLAWFVTYSFDSASVSLQERYDKSANPSVPVLRVLEGARYQLIQWILGSSLTMWLCASLFLARVETHQDKVRNSDDGRGRLVSWILLLVLGVILTGVIWYGTVSLPNVAGVLLSNSYLLMVALAFVLLPFAYWLATGLFVAGVMRPSIPISGLLPRKWS